jgi:hypothetical protein
MLFDIPLYLINETHLQSLVNATPEGRQIEYKQQLPGNAYDDSVEFLKDVSAMANSIGGDILYGVREGRDASGNTLAVAVEGVTGEDADRVILRLENLIRNSIKVRLIGLQIRPINLNNGNQVFIVRVPRSWNAPHVVEYQRHWRFYYRNSAGTHPMDVTELRHAMTFQDTLRRRLEEFRVERLAKIAGDETLLPTGKIVLHFQPLNSFDEAFEVDIRAASNRPDNLILMQYDGIRSNLRLNFDGLLANIQNDPQAGYLQIFRSGVIEEVSTRELREYREGTDYFIHAYHFHLSIFKGVLRRLQLLRELEVRSPLMFHLALLGVKGYRLMFDDMRPDRSVGFLNDHAQQHPIDRDDLLLRGILIEDLQAIDDLKDFMERMLHPLFNNVWSAAGFNESLYYNEEGRYDGQLHLQNFELP